MKPTLLIFCAYVLAYFQAGLCPGHLLREAFCDFPHLDFFVVAVRPGFFSTGALCSVFNEVIWCPSPALSSVREESVSMWAVCVTRP